MRKTAPLIGLKNIQVILNLRFDFCGIETPQVSLSDVKVQYDVIKCDVIHMTYHMTHQMTLTAKTRLNYCKTFKLSFES